MSKWKMTSRCKDLEELSIYAATHSISESFESSVQYDHSCNEIRWLKYLWRIQLHTVNSLTDCIWLLSSSIHSFIEGGLLPLYCVWKGTWNVFWQWPVQMLNTKRDMILLRTSFLGSIVWCLQQQLMYANQYVRQWIMSSSLYFDIVDQD